MQPPTSPKLSTFALKTIAPAVVVEAVVLPFWFLPPQFQLTLVPILEMALTAIILPIWFAASGIGYVNKSRASLWPLAICVQLTGMSISLAIAYLSWALSVGSILHPDPETVMVVELEACLGCIVSIGPAIITMALRSLVSGRK